MNDREMKRSFPPGTGLGRYTLGRLIGRGGMGAVYEATHNDLKKRVAIKALDPKFAHDPELSVRFLREGEAAARIQHPHVVDIYDVGVEGDVTYLVMELLVGEDLRALLNRIGSLNPISAADTALPVCAALAAAHAGGVIHRDLKPGNIFLSRGPHGAAVPKVLDFGISKNVDAPNENLTMTGALLGTPNYMSPEQAHGGRPVDHRTDVYSLGVVLYQCVTGVRPFLAESTYQVLHCIVQGICERPRDLNPNLDPALEQVVLRAMATQPENRFQTMAEFGAALLPFASPRLQAVWGPMFQRAEILGPRAAFAEAAYAEPVTPAGATYESRAGITGVPAGDRKPQRSAAFAMVVVLAVLLGGFAAYVLWPTPVQRVVAVPVTSEAPAADEEVPPPLDLPTPTTFKVSLTVTPAHAQILIDGEVTGRGRYDAELPRDGKPHVLQIRARGYRRHESTFTDTPPPSTIALTPWRRAKAPVAAAGAPTATTAVAKATRPARTPRTEATVRSARPVVATAQPVAARGPEAKRRRDPVADDGFASRGGGGRAPLVRKVSTLSVDPGRSAEALAVIDVVDAEPEPAAPAESDLAGVPSSDGDVSTAEAAVAPAARVVAPGPNPNDSPAAGRRASDDDLKVDDLDEALEDDELKVGDDRVTPNVPKVRRTRTATSSKRRPKSKKPKGEELRL